MNQLRALLVEDSPPDAELIVRELSRAGYSLVWERVETAAEMSSALDSGRWDVVLCDFALPAFDGRAALRLLREKDGDLPLIIVSGQIGEDVAVAAMKAGAADYIMKGNLKRLAPAIQREIDEARLRREHRQAEQDLRKREEELRLARQVEKIKDEFVSMVSHELKNPLTVIIGALRVALDKAISREDADQLIQDAVASADSLSVVIDNLVELSRSQKKRLTLRSEACDVGEIARTVEKRLRLKANPFQLTIDISPDLPAVPADPVRVERILYNLVDNAIKYSDGTVRVAFALDGDDLLTAVTDHGIGISPEDQRRLFRHFERLESAGEIDGVGLGLKVCQILVQAHGGRIWVASAAGEGSTFFFTLPLHPAP